MKKAVIFTLMFIFCGMNLFAQRHLTIKDQSSATDIFSGRENEAGLVISCPANIQLSFESTVDKTVNVYKTEMKGEESLYYIKFSVGKRYDGRRLSIIASGYSTKVIPIELESKQLKRYQIMDDDVEFSQGTYYEFRKRGLKYYEDLMYSEAKESFTVAKMSSDCPADSNIDELINNVDSITYFNKKAEEATELLDYSAAMDYYNRILALNPMDTHATTMRSQIHKLSTSDCTRYYNQAEVYYGDGEYEKAEELYQKVIALNCDNVKKAQDRLKSVQEKIANKKMKSRVLTVEFPLASTFKANGYSELNALDRKSSFNIGFSIGTYRSRKAGSYFSLNFNPGLIETLKKETGTSTSKAYEKNLEANIALGWTVNPAPKQQQFVWLFFTPFGYTLDCFYTTSEAGKNHDRQMCHAWTPEAGLTIKLGAIAIRYTFQYRYAFTDEFQAYSINGSNANNIANRHIRHQVGIGFCW